MRRRGRGIGTWGALALGAGGGGLLLWGSGPTSLRGFAPPPPLATARLGAGAAETGTPAARAPLSASGSAPSSFPGGQPSSSRSRPAEVSRPASLANARGWGQCNEAFYRLRAGPQRLADESARLARVDEAWRLARDPVARQNLIFLVALSFPWRLAEPWLTARLSESNSEDAEDARWALGLSGDPACLEALAAGAPEQLETLLVDDLETHEALGLTGGPEARRRLRAYRALEVIDRAPYFKRTGLSAHISWYPHPQAAPGGPWAAITWIDPERAAPPEQFQRLCELWLTRFPGHPGGDDVALRLGRILLSQQRPLAAARWFSRASLIPDQDVSHGALQNLLATAELLLGDAALDELTDEAVLSGRNGRLLRYVRARRLAARRGCAAGLSEVARLAAADPESPLAQAWARRWAVPVPRGLTSGALPLPSDDPLLRREPWEPLPVLSPAASARGIAPGLASGLSASELGRRDPYPEAVYFDAERLAPQLRLWETIAELARREEHASGDAARGAWRYKQAAVYFYQPEALFPVYASYTRQAERVVDSLWGLPREDEGGYQAAVAEFAQAAQGWRRAGALLAGIERRYPEFSGLDEALFTRGLCFERLLRAPWCRDQDAVIRELVGSLELLAERFPASPLADDATRAATYWRANWGEAFK